MTIISTSTGAFFERSRLDIKSLRREAETIQSQMSRGEKLSRSSDDPVAASRLRRLSRVDRLSDIDVANANRANTDLTLADSALSSVADFVIRAQELAVQAGNPTMNYTQRAAIGTELDQIHAQLVNLGNSRDAAGHALFGGETPGNAYTTDAAGQAVYIGTASSGALPLGDGQSVTRGLTGPEFFTFQLNGVPGNVLTTIKDLATALQDPTGNPVGAGNAALSSLNAGLDAVTTSQTILGTRLAWIELLGDRRVEVSELRATEQSELGGTDLASSIADLQEVMLVLEASQASFARLAGINLFAQLR
ncbi:MAG: flagellar biosynthesis protein FlgL [Novosphingobium sp.]|nr:flagellar biosynthesis protein FlgL [Novosphingobium sp.]